MDVNELPPCTFAQAFYTTNFARINAYSDNRSTWHSWKRHKRVVSVGFFCRGTAEYWTVHELCLFMCMLLRMIETHTCTCTCTCMRRSRYLFEALFVYHDRTKAAWSFDYVLNIINWAILWLSALWYNNNMITVWRYDNEKQTNYVWYRWRLGWK